MLFVCAAHCSARACACAGSTKTHNKAHKTTPRHQHSPTTPRLTLQQLDLWARTLVAGAVPGAGAGGLTREGFLTRWRAFALQVRARSSLRACVFVCCCAGCVQTCGCCSQGRRRRAACI